MALLKNSTVSFAVKVISFDIYYLLVCDFPTKDSTQRSLCTLKSLALKKSAGCDIFTWENNLTAVLPLPFMPLFPFFFFSTVMNFSINFSSAGFVETSLEHIKHVHVQLNMNSLQLEKGPSWKRKVGEHACCLTSSRTLFSADLLKKLGLCIDTCDPESIFPCFFPNR